MYLSIGWALRAGRHPEIGVRPGLPAEMVTFVRTDAAIRAELAVDTPDVHRVVAAAFAGRPVVADLVNALRDSTAWRPGLSLIAVQGDDIVGHVLATRGWLDAPHALVEVLVLSPLSVRPDRQGRGIGSKLAGQLLAIAARRPEPAIFLEGSPGFYARFGFESAGAAGIRRPSLRIPEPAFQIKRLPCWEPTLSGTLVYPEPFWAFDCVGLRRPS
jgi:putative acetyltransferase